RGAPERSTFFWIGSALFIAVWAWWQPIAGAAWRIDEPAVVWLLRVGQWLGGWLTLRSAWMIDFFELAGLRQVDDGGRVLSDPADQPVFKTSRPYGWGRSRV